MSHASSEELRRAHNEGQQEAKEDVKRDFVQGCVSSLVRGPSGDTVFVSLFDKEKSQELKDAFEQGVRNHNRQ